jgi:alkylation response protein AidB-like acyl-CoA dehydrogenase
MDFSFSAGQQQFRLTARAFFQHEVTDELLGALEQAHEEHDTRFHQRLAGQGWIGLQWPKAHGGLGLGDVESAILMEEAGYFFAPMTGYLVAVIAGSTILHTGTPEQVSRFLPGIAGGRTLFCLGYTEPESGSDLASLSTRAVPDGAGWRLEGAKMFTSLAHEAQFALVAARTDPDARKHRGLTVFVVPLDRPGIGVGAVPTLGGFRTSALSLDGVPVEQADVLGEVDRGWETLGAALDLERTGASRLGFCRRLLDYLWDELAGELDADTYLADVVGRLELRLSASRLLSYRAAWLVGQGKLPTGEAAMAKVVSTELAQDIAATVLRLAGEDALISRAGGGPLGGLVEQAYRNAARFTVTAGTSEIQRTIIATRLLDLPRGA